MGEKILSIGAAILTCGLVLGTNVHAEEIDCVIDPANEACVVTTSEDIPVNTSEDDLPPVTNGEVKNDVIFAGEDSDDDVEIIEEEEVEEEPALWPMYLSLGALGLAILVFITLSICSPKLKK